MKVFLADPGNLFPLRVFTLRKMFLALNFINLDCLAKFALNSTFKVWSGQNFLAPDFSIYCLLNLV